MQETLYLDFASKDGLVESVLEARSERDNAWLAETFAAAGVDQ
ncbi:hypothetical protein OG963_42755 [Streptomyces sp. NBC_01707]